MSFYFVGAASWSSAFRLLRSSDMLKHELQPACIRKTVAPLERRKTRSENGSRTEGEHTPPACCLRRHAANLVSQIRFTEP